MATIRKRGKSYHVQIRNRRLTAPLTRTFSSRRAAENWARETEQALIDGHYRDPRQLEGIRIADLIQRFMQSLFQRRCQLRLGTAFAISDLAVLGENPLKHFLGF